MADEAAPANFDAALAELAAELARMSPVERQETLDRARTVPGGMPHLPPLARPPTGEMRSRLSPEADALMGATGLPTAAGPALDMGIRLGRATGDAAAGSTMVPWAVETGQQLGEAASRASLQDFSDMLPSVPRANAEGDKLQELMAQQQMVGRQAEEARLRREGFRPKGRAPSPQADPQYSAADAEFKALTDRQTAIQRSIEQEQALRDPAYLEKLRQDRERADEEKRVREANTPWRVRNPALANALPNYAMAIAAGVPGAIGLVRNARTFFPGSVEGQMRSAVAENLLAREAGDSAKVQLGQSELRNLLASQPTKTNKLGEMATAAGAGGALTAEASMFPDQWDAANLTQGSPEQERARAMALNPLAYVERGGMGALTGASGYKIGKSLTPRRDAPVAKAQALVDVPFEGPSAPTALRSESAPALPKPTRGDGKPELPPGLDYNSRGLVYDKHTGQIVKGRYFQGREE